MPEDVITLAAVLQEQYKNIAGVLDDIKVHLTDVEKRIGGLEVQSRDVVRDHETIEDHSKRLMTVETALVALQGSFNSLQCSVKELSTTVKELSKTVSGLNFSNRIIIFVAGIIVTAIVGYFLRLAGISP